LCADAPVARASPQICLDAWNRLSLECPARLGLLPKFGLLASATCRPRPRFRAPRGLAAASTLSRFGAALAGLTLAGLTLAGATTIAAAVSARVPAATSRLAARPPLPLSTVRRTDERGR
jgi:hypothetical protein